MPQVLYNRGIQAPAVVAPPATIWFGATVPTAPQTVPNPVFTLPAPSATNHAAYYFPTTAAQLQTALNAAAASVGTGGDVIVLTAGTTYAGQITCPAHGTGNGTIYIVSSQIPELGGSLPAAGTRVGPANISNMPTITAPAASGFALTDTQSNNASSNYHIVGVCIQAPAWTNAQADNCIGMVFFGQSGSTTSSSGLPSNVMIDRCYINGDSTNGCRVGIGICGNNIVVCESYISNIFDSGNADNQAFRSYGGGVGYLLRNNYFSAAGESFIFGGADPAVVGIAPASDITISNNYIFKPTTIGVGKNACELKCAIRAAVHDNHIEACWGTQSAAIAITVRNQSGANTQAQLTDIDIYNNRIWNIIQPAVTTQGIGCINISGQDTPSSSGNPGKYSQPTHRVRVRNNMWLGNQPNNGGGSQMILVTQPNDANAQPTDIILDHNTFADTHGTPYTQSNWLYFSTPQNTTGLNFKNVVISNNAVNVFSGYGITGSDGSDVTYGMTGMAAKYLANFACVANAAITSSNKGSNLFPTGNYDVSSESVFQFNATGLSAEYPGTVGYVLLGSSPYYQQGVSGAGLAYTSAGTSDNTDIGANMSLVAQ